MEQRRRLIETAYADRQTLASAREAVYATIADLDAGRLRVAQPDGAGGWQVNTWIKQAILLYFGLSQVETIEVTGPQDAPGLAFQDKIPPKRSFEGVRVVPPGVARYGSYLEPGVILMPGYVNIGARVGRGSLIDTWATVGSCAQIGEDVHLSGGVGIGGVLEPPQAAPVIIEDGAFIGSRCVVVEGVRVGQQAVLGANVVLTASTPIIDVTQPEGPTTRGFVPPRAVVIPGNRPRTWPAGTFHVPCALIIGYRSESTDKKVSLNEALRQYEVAV